ncbi:MAG: GNAT family N-acetyltransferase [Bacilli bacterium]|nr:GNAT family N-acetyltransferase [Bacilli bacterium]
MIETDRLILRKLNEDDYKNISYYLDEKILEFASPYMPHKEEDLKNFILKIIGIASFSVTLKDGTFIGDVSITSIKPNDTGEIAYYFNPLYWKKGYAYEACKAVINYAFEQIKLKYITAQIDEANANSRKLVERLGFKLKILQKNVELHGRITNKCEYILIK